MCADTTIFRTKFLTIIENQVETAGYKYTRIDGSMPTKKRDAAIQALQEDPDCRIMLASLAVSSVGLNLVAADTVVLADSCKHPILKSVHPQSLTFSIQGGPRRSRTRLWTGE